MVKISHYEVYADSGNGWKLVNRFAAEERAQAFTLAKDKEDDKVSVKVIRETFDSSDGSYVESIEYIKGINKTVSKDKAPNKSKSKIVNRALTEKLSISRTLQAFAILVSIIVVSAIITNVLGTLLLPLLEMFIPQNILKTVFFTSLFIMFISIALPLVLHKVKWEDLSIPTFNKKLMTDEVFFVKASSVMSKYSFVDNVSEDETPQYPEASIAQKKEVIDLMAKLLTLLSDYKMNQYNKLGLKFIIYGATLEFANRKKLKMPHINSILYEAIGILDGKESDLVNFYQAKKSYKENRDALYLTGLGTILMGKHMSRTALDKSLVTYGFERWAKHNTNIDSTNKKAKDTPQSAISVPNIVTIKYNIKLFDTPQEKNQEVEQAQFAKIKEIMSTLLKKFNGSIEKEDENQTSFLFKDLIRGIAFAKQLLSKIDAYSQELDEDSIIFNVKINLIKKQDNNDNSSYIEDLFSYANDDEILTTLNIVNEAKEEENLEFEPIGRKRLEKTAKNLELFKIL